MIVYPVTEKFISINGEGTKAGELAVFIRFRSCNLACSYCDTRWANAASAPAEMTTADELVQFSEGIKNITLTGGEPLLQQNLYHLIERLVRHHHEIEIETNGAVSVKDLSSQAYRPSFTMDYKLPSSNMESSMLTENFQFLCEKDTVKFVAGSREDLERADEIIKTYSLTEKCYVYFSPVFGRIQPAEIVAFMREKNLNNVRLQLQMHKYIWDPQKRGV